jgi:hypothetical protein
MNTMVSRIKKEIVGVFPAAIFFFIAFQLLALTRALILEEYGIQVSTFVNATIAALIVAKIVLIVDMMPFVNRYPHKPLIYNVLWKTIIYFSAALAVRYVEHLIPFVRDYGDLALANRHLLDKVIWPHFWGVQIWLLVYFFMFCTIRELIRVLGQERVRTMFFGPVGGHAA